MSVSSSTSASPPPPTPPSLKAPTHRRAKTCKYTIYAFFLLWLLAGIVALIGSLATLKPGAAAAAAAEKANMQPGVLQAPAAYPYHRRRSTLPRSNSNSSPGGGGGSINLTVTLTVPRHRRSGGEREALAAGVRAAFGAFQARTGALVAKMLEEGYFSGVEDEEGRQMHAEMEVTLSSNLTASWGCDEGWCGG
ncbi:hypothetical protein BU26DRAFT_113230 [Trematosphaeria pertusa]|uniref:Uncharacterized protein n=1 Tax=Trematosphaeria pertusa TaxID=390896 RepID=A0A6A6HYW8_9PLEO|nr:uncharacterized protein BU26DRAFT_113230 [Trematosphaeria pertusa]KAF2243216.1 hypothetical protein BU26DRAFT_113230 [Trematosphaeria pertusa]